MRNGHEFSARGREYMTLAKFMTKAEQQLSIIQMLYVEKYNMKTYEEFTRLSLLIILK